MLNRLIELCEHVRRAVLPEQDLNLQESCWRIIHVMSKYQINFCESESQIPTIPCMASDNPANLRTLARVTG